jgi:uncharacterized protein involved in propanediol utilization
MNTVAESNPTSAERVGSYEWPQTYRVGTGACGAHHGELFQGQIYDQNRNLRRCLMTLPCAGFRSKVTFYPEHGAGLRVEPQRKNKAKRTVRLLLDSLGHEELGGVLIVNDNITEGKGYGSSTSDCVAAARAAADSLGVALREEEIARIVVTAETASDNTMFSNAALFAQREGIVLEHYTKSIPDLEMIGFDTEPNRQVDTLEYIPASYNWKDIQCFEMLVAALRRAIQTQDRDLLGRVAQASADINQRFLPKPAYPELRALSQQAGALGVAVAHSGTVASILLNPLAHGSEQRFNMLYRELEHLGFSDIRRFQTHPSQIRRT